MTKVYFLLVESVRVDKITNPDKIESINLNMNGEFKLFSQI